MTPLANLVDIAAVLAFALLVAGGIWSGLRLLVRSDTDSRAAEAAAKPRRRLARWHSALAGFLLVYVLLTSAHAAQAAFGSPMGEPVSPVVTVVEVRECERPVTGFGLVRLCTLSVYLTEEPLPSSAHPDIVVTGGAIEPGDRVAKYAASGWVRFVQIIGGEPQWRSLDDAGKPNLVWLQAAASVAGLLAVRRLSRLRARDRAAAGGKIGGRIESRVR